MLVAQSNVLRSKPEQSTPPPQSNFLFLFRKRYTLLQLFLGAKLSGVSTLLLTAILGTRWKTSIAFTADGLVAVVSLGQQRKRWVVDSSSQTKNQMKCGLLLDIVVGKGAAVFELLSSENQTLLIRRNSFFVLNLGLDVVNGITWLDIERDGLTRQSLDEYLHGERCY